jgi:hypothetical protein
MEIPWDAPRAFALGFNTMLPALKALSLGYFSLGQQRKVTRAAAAVRNARRVGGQIAVSRQPNTEALDYQPFGFEKCLRPTPPFLGRE